MENLKTNNNSNESNNGYKVFLKGLLSKIKPRLDFKTQIINHVEVPEEIKNNPEFLREKSFDFFLL